jgi:hypothetical protein
MLIPNATIYTKYVADALSPHPCIVNLLYADGSVRAATSSLDLQILKSATRDEGPSLELALQ